MKQVILTHGGAWAQNQLTKIAYGYDSDAQVFFANHCEETDNTNLTKYFECYYKTGLPNSYQCNSKDQEHIKRCRFLRELPESEAYLFLLSMKQAWLDVLSETKPKAVISEAIDSYVISTLEENCKKLDIQFIGLVASFINGYFRITKYGELNISRQPSLEEIDIAIEMLLKENYKPSFLSKNIKIKTLENWTKNIARYFINRIKIVLPKLWKRNHIHGSFITSRKNLHFIPRFFLGDNSWKDKVKHNNLPIIFIPLQHVPEATIDYWCSNLELINYESCLIGLIEKHNESFTFLIKEHPNIIGFRHPRLYSKLKSLKNTIIIPTKESATHITKICDAVLVWTGSVGFEAALRGKPVITMCDSYYIFGDFFKVISNKTDTKILLDFITEMGEGIITQETQRSMVKHLLSGLLKGNLYFSKKKKNNFDEKEYIDIGREIKQHYHET